MHRTALSLPLQCACAYHCHNVCLLAHLLVSAAASEIGLQSYSSRKYKRGWLPSAHKVDRCKSCTGLDSCKAGQSAAAGLGASRSGLLVSVSSPQFRACAYSMLGAPTRCGGTYSMSTTLLSFCTRLSSRSPCLMAAWYSAVLASGLGAQGAGRMGEGALGAQQWLGSRFVGPGGSSCSSSAARTAGLASAGSGKHSPGGKAASRLTGGSAAPMLFVKRM